MWVLILCCGFDPGCYRFLPGILKVELEFFVDAAEFLEEFSGALLGELLKGVYTSLVERGYPLGGDTDCGESGLAVAALCLLGAHLGEEKNFLDVGLSGHHHHESVDTHTHARCRRHAVLERAYEVLVDDHSFVVTLIGEFHLLDKSLVLVDGVVELGVCVAEFLAVYHQLETFGELGVRAVFLGEGRHLDGVVDDECGLDVFALAGLAEYLVDEFSLAHCLVDLDTESDGYIAQGRLVHASDVYACILLDGVDHCYAAERGLERDDVVADLDIGGAVDVEAYFLKELFGEFHHPVVVLVGNVYLHACELGVVGAVHALVAEVLADLVYAVKSTYDEAFEVQLGSDAQVQVDVERVVVGYKRTCAGTTGDRLQYRGLDLHVAVVVEESAHGVEYLGAFDEDVFYALVDDEVDIAAAVAQLGIVEGIVGDAVLDFHDGERAERLAENHEVGCVDRDFAGLCAEHVSLDAYDVANVEQFLEHNVVEILVFSGAKLVAVKVNLDTSGGVLELHECRFTHDAACHDASGHYNLSGSGLVVGEVGFYFIGVCVDRPHCGRIWVYAASAHLIEGVTAHDLLFAKFKYIHNQNVYSVEIRHKGT